MRQHIDQHFFNLSSSRHPISKRQTIEADPIDSGSPASGGFIQPGVYSCGHQGRENKVTN